MSASYEWTDWHLTPNGWVRGTMKTDAGVQSSSAPPSSVVATFRYSEDHPGYGTADERVVMRSPEGQAPDEVQALMQVYGECPCSLR
jgi:hypothetical protein